MKRSTYSGALREVNIIRKVCRRRRLTRLPPGYQGDCWECPIARAVDGTADQRKLRVRAPLKPGGFEEFRTPSIVADFISEFDDAGAGDRLLDPKILIRTRKRGTNVKAARPRKKPR